MSDNPDDKRAEAEREATKGMIRGGRKRGKPLPTAPPVEYTPPTVEVAPTPEEQRTAADLASREMAERSQIRGGFTSFDTMESMIAFERGGKVQVRGYEQVPITKKTGEPGFRWQFARRVEVAANRGEIIIPGIEDRITRDAVAREPALRRMLPKEELEEIAANKGMTSNDLIKEWARKKEKANYVTKDRPVGAPKPKVKKMMQFTFASNYTVRGHIKAVTRRAWVAVDELPAKKAQIEAELKASVVKRTAEDIRDESNATREYTEADLENMGIPYEANQWAGESYGESERHNFRRMTTIPTGEGEPVEIRGTGIQLGWGWQTVVLDPFLLSREMEDEYDPDYLGES